MCVPHELQVSAINLFQHEFNSHLVCASLRSSSAVPSEGAGGDSTIYIVKILSLPYLNMAISYKDLPCVAVPVAVGAAAAGAPAGLIS